MSEFKTVHLWYKSPDFLYEAKAKTSFTLDMIIVGEPLGTETAILAEPADTEGGAKWATR